LTIDRSYEQQFSSKIQKFNEGDAAAVTKFSTLVQDKGSYGVYTVSQKGDTILLSISLLNIDRFSQFLQ